MSNRRAMSGRVSSFDASVICTAPTTSSCPLGSVKWWVATGSGSAGVGSSDAAGAGGGDGVRIGWEPISAHAARQQTAAHNAAVRNPRMSGWGVTRGILEEYRLVGQFVARAALARKMLCQQARDTGHGRARAGIVTSVPVLRLDLAAHELPVIGGNALTDAAVGDDLDRAVGVQHVDEHAVVRARVPDVQVREGLDGPLARAQPVSQCRPGQRAFDREADLPIVPGFGSADGGLDVREDRGAEAASRPSRAGE